MISLTPCSRVLLEKLTVSHKVNEFSTLYETQRVSTVSSNSRHVPRIPSQIHAFQSIHPIYLRSILIHCLKTQLMHYALKYTLKTQSLFKTLECLLLLCHPTCFGHILDHLQGMFLVQCNKAESSIVQGTSPEDGQVYDRNM